jgi:heat shock protein HtpX
MFKRFGLLLLTNLLVVLTISILLRVLGLDRYTSGYGINYGQLLGFCLVWGFAGSFISLFLSKFMAKMSMGVQVIDPRQPGQFGEIVDMVHRLSQKAGLPVMPEVGVYDSPDVNAFATGPSRSNSLVAVSTGLLRSMDRKEVEGVVGHEVAHIANGDMVTMTLIQGVINAFVMFISRVLAWGVAQALRGRREDNEGPANPWVVFGLTTLFEIIFGVLGMLVVSWFSRHREYRADAGSARYAGKDRMIAALRALQSVHDQPVAEAGGKQFAAFKIRNSPGGFLALLSTHPPLEERIARLQKAD